MNWKKEWGVENIIPCDICGQPTSFERDDKSLPEAGRCLYKEEVKEFNKCVDRIHHCRMHYGLYPEETALGHYDLNNILQEGKREESER